MAYEVDFTKVSTIGLESSPVATALAGLRANEARYFKNKYSQAFVVERARKARKLIAYVRRIPKQERDIVIESRPPASTELHVENIRWTFVFYERDSRSMCCTRSTTRRSAASASGVERGELIAR